MSLTGKQRHYLRGLAHHRKPIVTVADAGLTPNVLAEIDQALARHELIKVRIRNDDRGQRKELMDAICAQAACEPVQTIGQIGVLYRPAEEPQIKLPR